MSPRAGGSILGGVSVGSSWATLGRRGHHRMEHGMGGHHGVVGGRHHCVGGGEWSHHLVGRRVHHLGHLGVGQRGGHHQLHGSRGHHHMFG